MPPRSCCFEYKTLASGVISLSSKFHFCGFSHPRWFSPNTDMGRPKPFFSETSGCPNRKASGIAEAQCSRRISSPGEQFPSGSQRAEMIITLDNSNHIFVLEGRHDFRIRCEGVVPLALENNRGWASWIRKEIQEMSGDLEGDIWIKLKEWGPFEANLTWVIFISNGVSIVRFSLNVGCSRIRSCSLNWGNWKRLWGFM